MTQKDKKFLSDTGLDHAINLLREMPMAQESLPHSFPERGIGEIQALDLLAPHVLGRAAHLD